MDLFHEARGLSVSGNLLELDYLASKLEEADIDGSSKEGNG
jgi:hypothetical protein